MRQILTAFLILFLTMAGTSAQGGKSITVFAAASLRDVLEQAVTDYSENTGHNVRLVLAASSVLARQIEAGAPADIYISANEEWIDWLVERNSIAASKTRILAGNVLIVAFPPGSKPQQKLDGMLTRGRFAMGDPGHVPAGRYAASALTKLNIWDIVQPFAIYCENVRVALEFVRRGEVSAAIVYGSDLTAAPELVKAYEFLDDSHAPIRYAAVPVSGDSEDADGFLDFLSGPNGQALFAQFGFADAR